MRKLLLVFVALLVLLPTNLETAFASTASDIIKTGEKYIGTPYNYGARYGNTSSFDCSSYTKWVFSRHGIDLHRSSRDQATQGTYVSKSNLQAGDLVFYDTSGDGRINHVGIYAGNGKMLNAQSSGVKYADAFSPYYWGSRYVTARRVIPEEKPEPPEPTVKALSFSTTAERLSGANRFEVAANISKKGWNQASTVYLTNYTAFADALSASPLAYKNDAPILLTLKDRLSAETKNEISRLNPTKVVLVGGAGSISDSVINDVKSINSNIQVDRIAGQNRFEVSYNIAKELGTANKAVVANGLNYPDALAIAPYAARNGFPILLTAPTSLPTHTNNALKELGVSQTIVVGGEASVGKNVYSAIPSPTRIGGKDRFEVASNITSQLYQSPGQAFIATGLTFADALTGSVLAAKQDSPMLLTRSDRLPEAVFNIIEKDRISSFKVLGGTGSVNAELYNELNN